jgi:phosphoenolpyruvate carboxylase
LTLQPAHVEASEGTPLARETELLSQLLRCVLVEQCGEPFAADVDWLHSAAADLRAGDQAAGAALMRRLRELPTAEMEPYIRACSLQLQLANLAEERERIRRRRTYDAPGTRQRESLADTAAHLQSRHVDGNEAIRALHIELVLTAHPTEATRRSILDHQWDLLELLDRLDDPRTGSSRRRSLLDDARTILTIWWQTDDVRRARPRVEDEVRRNLFFFERLFDAVPETFAELERTLSTRVELPVISFGSWAGSDMDGHPEVGADTLSRTLQLHRETALRLLRDRVRALARRYSHADRRVPLTPALEESLARDEAELPTADVLRRTHRAWEPLRTKLGFVEHRLTNTLRVGGTVSREPGYASPDELRADLALVRECLGSEHVAHGAIRQLLWQVDVFGFHLASLDVRQSSGVLREAASALLPGYARAEDEAQRITLLAEAIEAGRRGLSLAPDGAAGELLRVLDTVALADGGYGREAVPTLVISMVERPSDVLTALWLARRAGIGTGPRSGPHPPPRLRLVPLFETLADLQGAPETMATLYGCVPYRDDLRTHGDRQTVMLGYSDSGKDTGFVSSQWALHVAQERLSAQADEHGLALELFHGRGGSTSRGGGRSYEGILAQPRRSVRGRIRITEQGETVSARYGHPELALRALEQTTSAVLMASNAPGPEIPPAWRDRMNQLASRSRSLYRALVYEDEDFLRFFTQATPIAELGDLNIGSRPPSRAGGAGGVESLRAIPWVFAWTQNRLLLPSWYGAGTALSEAPLGELRSMRNGWPFFASVISTLEMALFKADPDVTVRYLRLVDEPVRERLWPTIADEYERLVRRLPEITGESRLLGSTPALLSRLSHRNPWVDPLNHLQVELLGRLRSGDEDGRSALLATISGIAAGLRNTG